VARRRVWPGRQDLTLAAEDEGYEFGVAGQAPGGGGGDALAVVDDGGD